MKWRVLFALGAMLPASVVPMRAETVVLSSDLEWSYSQYNDEFNKGRTTSSLSLAIPETDAVAFHAFCVAGSSGNFSVARFGADTQGLGEGDPVSIKFSTHSWEHTMQGNAAGTQAEVGVSGVEVIIENDDAVWEIMSTASRFFYEVRDEKVQIVSEGAARPIAQFLDDCRFYSTGYTNAGNETKDPRWATCSAPENQQSVDLRTPVTVTFRNQSEGYRSVFWMGYDGQPVNYANLDVGQEFKVNTSVGHPWMFTDGPGNCIEMFQPKVGVTIFEISAPSPEFGPE